MRELKKRTTPDMDVVDLDTLPPLKKNMTDTAWAEDKALLEATR